MRGTVFTNVHVFSFSPYNNLMGRHNSFSQMRKLRFRDVK